MIPLEQQVTSLEWSKRLQEFGVKQESAFYHYCQAGGIICDTDVRGKWIIRRHAERGKGFGEYVSAFTCSELGKMLPPAYTTSKTATGKWLAFSTGDIEGNKDFMETLSETEANARAALLANLIENKIVSVESVNERFAL